MATKKRAIDPEKIDRLIDEVDDEIANFKAKEISSELIGMLLLRKLFYIDQVSALRFASVYSRFDSLESFNEQIEAMRQIPSEEALSAQYTLLEKLTTEK